MSMRIVLIIIVFFGAIWALSLRGSHVQVTKTTEPVAVDHPVAECPGCVGPSVDKQPQPVVPSEYNRHEDYVPTTKPVPYHETQPGPPNAPKFGEPKR